MKENGEGRSLFGENSSIRWGTPSCGEYLSGAIGRTWWIEIEQVGIGPSPCLEARYDVDRVF